MPFPSPSGPDLYGHLSHAGNGRNGRSLFRSPAYKHIQASWYPRLSAVPTAFWQAHAVLTELVIFNLSSLFDRIAPREARDLALQINQLVHARPLNHYVLVYRDDAGPCMHNHSYTAFVTICQQS